MSKKFRKNKKPINSFAALLLAISIVVFGMGVVMAVNSCSPSDEPDPIVDGNENDNNTDNNENTDNENTPSVSGFLGLETVIIPENIPSQIKDYTGFTVSFNKENKTPNYVVWELLGSEVGGSIARIDNFWQDKEIEGCPTTYDYTRSGYDRGHMCPAADQKWSEEAMNDCFVMANICPQLNDLNAHAWKNLEDRERQWAQRDSAIWIVCGPIYLQGEEVKTIGTPKIRVPDAFFKVLMAPYLKEPRGIAFVFPHMAVSGNMQDYAMSIDDLEKDLNYNFFSTLPDDIEEKVESSFSFKEWNNSK